MNLNYSFELFGDITIGFLHRVKNFISFVINKKFVNWLPHFYPMSSDLFRLAKTEEIPEIWQIFEDAILRRKKEGSSQWQDGYPNPAVIKNDIDKGVGYILSSEDSIIGYCAIMVNDEPAYANITGNWLTDGDFVVIHRVAVAEGHVGKGFAKKMLGHIEAFAVVNNIRSIKADTNFDNFGMLKVFERMGYVYCGEVVLRGWPRKAFEKVLKIEATKPL